MCTSEDLHGHVQKKMMILGWPFLSPSVHTVLSLLEAPGVKAGVRGGFDFSQKGREIPI